MKIVHIIPGSGGGFYCGNCLRDSKFFDAMRNKGFDAIKLPMYLPLFSHDLDGNNVPVFYGAVSLYLKQQYALFRRAPRWIDSLLNSKPMLKFAAKMANSTRAKGLEDMTISMLLGEDGQQKDELEKMVSWLENNYKADIIHISNALLLGLAHKVKTRLKIPVVCSLQDEDVWVNVMSEDFQNKIWALMKEKAKDIDVFISVSHYYTKFMKEKLGLSDDKITTLHLGVDPSDYNYINSSVKKKNIGFLSRLCKDNGLDILIDAFIIFKKNAANESSNLFLTGGYTADDKKFLSEQKQKVKNAGLESSVFFIDDFELNKRKNFFENIAVLSVPVRNGEAFGIYLTEAMASGVPIVQPPLGAFPEIIEKSGGGIVYNENTPQSLAEALNELLNNKELLQQLSQLARQSIENKFNINDLATGLSQIYSNAIKTNSSKLL